MQLPKALPDESLIAVYAVTYQFVNILLSKL